MDELWSRVEKPARYTGGEYHAVIKEGAKIRFAFCFPDLYEVGMSHLGLKILYQIINSRPDAWCERAFAPFVDMERELRQAGEPLRTLESHTPLSEMDLVGFTLQYEMSYTNILTMLDLGGVPLRAAERRNGPFVVLGGPCALNPEPLTLFADLVVLGEGEEVIHELLDAYAAWKEAGEERDAFLRRAAALEGVYVPAFYDVEYEPDGRIRAIAPNRPGVPPTVTRRIVWDLEHAPYPDRPPVPYVEAVHDRNMAEIFRGCTRGCRFCQAGMIYRPVRERSPETVVRMACDMADNTGYEELSLASLSTGDYSGLPALLPRLLEEMGKRRVDVSLPSLRVDSDLAALLPDLRKGGLTLAPEAGTQRLRNVINKNVTEEELMHAAADAFGAGWNAVKLYFMLGLPTETMEDVEGIAKLAHGVADIYYALPKERRARGLRVTVSTSCFVPKPHTPFQWCAQDRREAFMEKQSRLASLLKRRGLEYRWHDPALSYWEAVFARGDRRLGEGLLAAWRLGCRFDGWQEHFRPDLWRQGLEEAGLDPDFYACRARERDEQFPWEHLSAGVSRSFLWREYQNALAGKLTPDCRQGCIRCGVREGGCH